MPISVSTSGTLDPGSDEGRANSVLTALEEINTFRIAAQRTPFAMPVRGKRALHLGLRQSARSALWRAADAQRRRLGGAAGHADPGHRRRARDLRRAAGGYGNLVIVQHDFGIETYYAHLHTIDVNVGQRVSRGDRIGGMGTTGRSTGVHLHYEIRVGGRPINPMSYIRAAQNVF
jgi:murein DD-endopeptidase MepM/ murein hydrolase activator NlpD